MASSPVPVTWITGVVAAADVMTVSAAVFPLPAPSSVTRLLTMTFSL